MSRFQTTAILFLITIIGAGGALDGFLRWVVLGILLFFYLFLLILGVSVLKLNFFVHSFCRGEATAKGIVLSFDDGPDPSATPALLQVLRRHQIKAAFFPIGANVKKYPDIIKQIDQEGHVLGNHTFRHVWWTNFLISRSLDKELEMAQEAIVAACGKIPAFFRPPMGLTNPHLKGSLKKRGLSVVGWDVRPFDTGADAERVTKKVLKKIRPGSIILLHDRGRTSPELVRLIEGLITEIKARGYGFCGLDELTGKRPYQTREEARAEERPAENPDWRPYSEGKRTRNPLYFLAQKLTSTGYARRAIQEPVTLDAFKTRPSVRFLWGVSFVLLSYVLGWPMVALFSILAAYLRNPALLMVGPACYGFSHLVFLFGMYLAGRDCIKYVDILSRWGMRRALEKALNLESEKTLKE